MHRCLPSRETTSQRGGSRCLTRRQRVIRYIALLALCFFVGLATQLVASARADNYGGVGNSTKAAVRAEVAKQFPSWTHSRVYCIIGRESGWNPRAVNWRDANGGSHGLFQINGINRRTMGESLWAKRYTIWGSVRMAYLLWRGRGFAPWSGGHYGC